MYCWQVDAIDFEKAIDYFRRCFGAPSEFKIVFVGNLKWDDALPLFTKYLAAIPTARCGPYKLNGPLKAVKASFPLESVEEVVRLSMIEPQGRVGISLPFGIPIEAGRIPELTENLYMVALICRAMDKAMTELLRFEEGKTYN